VYPEISIGPLTLQTFGLMFGIAFIAAGMVVARRFGELGRPPDWAYEVCFAAGVGGLIGARMDFLIQNWSDVSDDLIGNMFSGSGLVWFGGVVGGALAVLLWARWRGILNLGLLDTMAAPLALGYAVGRVGCQLSGDGDYGKEWDGPWAMAYPEGTVAIDVPVHPTPVYESLAMGAVAIVLWHLRDRFAPGRLFALYLLLAGLERFAIEFLRRNEAVLAGLTQAQLLSIVMILAGVVWLYATRAATAPQSRRSG
jgi:phosphatidylglycerol---prolipoprotein diacylglyceryl transferase